MSATRYEAQGVKRRICVALDFHGGCQSSDDEVRRSGELELEGGEMRPCTTAIVC